MMKNSSMTYVYATNKSWNIDVFMKHREELSGHWQICVTPEDLNFISRNVMPRYVFFPHWSSIVPSRFLEEHECVCFHMADVPYGRGGSPLQNLIARGHKETILTALQMTPEIDAGPIYLKRPLSLDGTAEEIFRRAAEIGMEMMKEITQKEPEPVAQTGEPFYFERRKPAQSTIPERGNLQELYDHIRMLDAPGYPHAFLKHGDWIATVRGAEIRDRAVEARIRFVQMEHEEQEET